MAIKRVLPSTDRKTESKSINKSNDGSPSRVAEDAAISGHTGSGGHGAPRLDIESGLSSQTSSNNSSQTSSANEAQGATLKSNSIASNGILKESTKMSSVIPPKADVFDLLGGCSFSFEKRAGLSRWLPRFQKKGNSQLKHSILGSVSGASSARTVSLTAALCPCLDEHSRMKAEFVSEMRVSSTTA